MKKSPPTGKKKSTAKPVKTKKEEILFGVIPTDSSTKQYRVVSYNRHSNVLVFDCDGTLITTNAIKYDGKSKYIEWVSP